MSVGSLPTQYLVLFALITMGIAVVITVQQSALTSQSDLLSDVGSDIMGEDQQGPGSNVDQPPLFGDGGGTNGGESDLASVSGPILVQEGESITKGEDALTLFDANSGLTTNVWFKSSELIATTQDIFTVSECSATSRSISLRPLNELDSPNLCNVAKSISTESGTAYITLCEYSEQEESAKILITSDITLEEAQQQCQQTGSSIGDSDGSEGQDGGSDEGDGDFSPSGSEGFIQPTADYSQYDQKYVSTEGSYDAQGTENDPWSVRAAEDKTQPGTVVNFLPGTYSTTVEPPSGTDGNPVIFRSSERHQAKMQRQEGNALNFKMIGKSHITIQGFYINAGPGRWLLAWDSDYITIRDNFMEEAVMDYNGGTPVDIDEGSSYVNLINNKMVTSKKGNMVEVSSSEYVKIVGNVVSEASHSALQVEDNENIVIRANVLHNPIGRAGGISNGRNQLFENNVMTINFAGPGSGGSSTKVFGQNAISRYNRLFNFYGAMVNIAIFNNAFEATDSRYYHNTFHDAVDRGSLEGQAYDNWGGVGRMDQDQFGYMRNLEFENNIYHELGKEAGREYLELGETDSSQHQFFNNFFGSTGADPKIDYNGRDTVQEKEQENPQMFSDNIVGDSPGFEDAASYDHKLADGSQLIDAGKHLTSAENSGPGTTLEVDDPLYFYDGFGIPGERGDLIQVGSERARVTEVNGNQLELSESIDWGQGDGVSMAYGGSAPDIGAHEKSGRPQIIIDKSSHMVNTGEQVQLTAKMVNLPQMEEICWQFGDTEGKCGQQVTHSYDQPGGKGIRVRAVDSNGNTYWDSAFIKVGGSNTGFPGIDYNIRKTENFLCDGEDGIYTDAGETDLVETEDGWVCE